METIVGSIVQIRFYNEQSKFIVALIDEENIHQKILVTGNMLEPQLGLRFRFNGDYVIHPKYGEQFKFIGYEEVLANDYDEIIRYLSSSLFKGIGKIQATRIVDTLGENALEMIKEDPLVLSSIQGMTQSKIDTIYQELNKNNQQETIQFLYQHGLSLTIIEKIIQTYQENTLDLIKHQPYQLLEDIENISFKNVDKLALALGIPIDDQYRIDTLVVYCIKEMCYNSGNTYVLFNHLIERLGKVDFQLKEETYIEAINRLKEAGKLIIRDEKIFIDLYEMAETNIKEAIDYFIHLPINHEDLTKIEQIIETIEQRDQIQFASNQRQAIIDFVKYPLMILTGGPGTGKTTIVKAVIEVYKKLYQSESIALVAPTGRAAKRLSELTNLEAQTIHRLLHFDISNNEFMFDEDHPIECDLLIIDEFSMVDTILFDYLLQASRMVKKILIIGDHEQLPSVSPGNLLSDLLSIHQIHSICLEKIYRQKQSSGIIQLAHAISSNQDIEYTMFKSYEDINFITCQNHQVLSLIQKIVIKALNEGYDYNDFQILAPMYQGVAGINAINEMLQNLLNPMSEYVSEIKIGRQCFREGDKVLQLKNRVEDNVFNGDIGRIVEIHLKDNFEYLSDTIVVAYDDKLIEYTSNDFNQITLAYCMSIHKAQGSEFKIVIMPILNDYYIMLKKNLIYTGITRAKQSLFLIGQSQAFFKGIKQKQNKERLTYLKQRFNTKKQNELSPYDFMD